MSRDRLFELDRRHFLTLGALAAAAQVIGCGPEKAPVETPSTPTPFELEELDLATLSEGLESGRFTSRMLVESYLERIRAINEEGPALRAVLELEPRAVEIADQLDQERAEGQIRGPLHGIPILLKDNIATQDGTTTTAGSLALQGSKPPEDAHLAARLREAGAVLLGKANLSEWANFRSTRSSSGWSGRGGQCRNPYSLDRTPCGSSSGSGAAVAANMVAAAIGTETNGSIVCPASHNGIVGLKPTVGLVSRHGVIPISETQDTAGPMTRTVKGAAILLSAIAGVDERDPATSAAAEHLHADYTSFLGDGNLEGLRLGVSRGHFGFHPDIDAIMEKALEDLSALGAELVDPIELPNWGALEGSSYELMLYEFKHGLNAYFAWLGDDAPVKNIDELIAWNQENAGASMPYFGQEIIEAAAAKGDLDDPAYLEAKAKAKRVMADEGIDKTMDDGQLDAIVAPTNGPSWRIDLVNGDNFGGGSSTPAAVAGYPSITVPAGSVQGLPAGLSIFGRAWSEPVLLRIAYAYEQATKHRRVPEFRPNLGLA